MRKFAYILLVLFAVGCQRQEPTAQAPAEVEPHPESFTNWTTKTELFAEYLPLVTEQTSRFAVHFTRLDTFKPVAKGAVEIRLANSQGKVESFRTEGPSSPGIFGIDVSPSAAGEFSLSVALAGEGLNDVHDLGPVEVSATKAAALHEHGDPAEEKIAFLKEQQWTLDFRTAVIEDRRMRASLRVPAEVMPRSGGEAEVAVPFDGRLVIPQTHLIGARVGKGDVLASILPPTSSPSDLSSLELTRSEASLALQLATKDRERAERLVQSGAVPAKRLDEARTVEATAEVRLRAAEARIAQYESSSTAAIPEGAKLFAVRAPISGILTEILATPGSNVKAGEILFRILDADTVYVSATVPEAKLPQLRDLSGAELEIPGVEQPRALGKLISIGRVVDPNSRTVPVIYQVENRDRRLAIHQAVYVRLLTSATDLAPAVPESAIVDDGGRPVIFLQDSGEAFVRRPVTLGVREGGLVQVLEGVFPGERVVTEGAHLIRLASMSNQVPAHGHVH